MHINDLREQYCDPWNRVAVKWGALKFDVADTYLPGPVIAQQRLNLEP